MAYTPISLRDAMKEINVNWFLPAIQRPYVWGNRYEYEKYICRLFDSLYHKYPIGVLILWKTSSKVAHREFLHKITEKLTYANADEGLWGRSKSLVYDGQQRLQTLYSCLYYSIYNTMLVFDLNYDESQDLDSNTGFRLVDRDKDLKPFEIKLNYLFTLSADTPKSEIRKTFNQAAKDEAGNDCGEYDIIMNRIEKNLDDLWDIFVNDTPSLAFYSIAAEKEEKVNEIFERLNTGGMSLSNSDILFAKIVGNKTYKSESFQTDIMDFCEEMNQKYHFYLDAYDVLQIINLIVRGSARISVDVTANEIKEFCECWEKLKRPLEAFIGDYLIGQLNLTSQRIIRNKYPLFVIAIYFYKAYSSGFKFRELETKTLRNINKFFITAEINDWTLQSYTDKFTEIILNNPRPNEFPFEKIEQFVKEKDNRPIGISENRFKSYKWMALKFLMPTRQFEFNDKSRNRINPELDHIFPVHLKNMDNEYSKYVDTVWNMQPVKGEVNNMKKNFHPQEFFMDTAKNRSSERINGSKYFQDYDFLPPIASELWGNYANFINWRRSEMIGFLKDKYDIILQAESNK